MTPDDRRRRLKLQKLGRFLSLVLKHGSVRFPVQLDAEGYATSTSVLRILKGLPNFRWATLKDIRDVVELPGHQRFEILDGPGRGLRIRAVPAKAATRPHHETVTPPALLYYGTAPENLETIQNEGIKPAEHPYVRLAKNLAAARSIGVRICPDPVILHIDAAAAHAAGYLFYQPAVNIFLTEWVPVDFIQEYQ